MNLIPFGFAAYHGEYRARPGQAALSLDLLLIEDVSKSLTTF